MAMDKWAKRGIWAGGIAAVILGGYLIFDWAKHSLEPPQKEPELKCETLEDEVSGYKIIESHVYDGMIDYSADIAEGTLIAKVQKGENVYSVEYIEGSLKIEVGECPWYEEKCESFAIAYGLVSIPRSKELYLKSITIVSKNNETFLECEYIGDERGKRTVEELTLNNPEQCPGQEETRAKAEKIYRTYACLLQLEADRIAREKEEAKQMTTESMDKL